MTRGEAIEATQSVQPIEDPSAALYGDGGEIDGQQPYDRLNEETKAQQAKALTPDPVVQAETAKVDAERRSPTRVYTVFERIDDVDGKKVWKECGEAKAASVEQAIRQFVGRNEDQEGTTLFAIPVRSYRPMTVQVKTKRSFVVE